MNLENFLEKDITDFLEEKERETEDRRAMISEEIEDLSLEKDYTDLFKNALDRRDLSKAKKLFEEIHEKYAKASDQLEKQAYTNLINHMLIEIKRFDANEGSEKALIQEITNMPRLDQEEQKSRARIKSEMLVANRKLADYLSRGDLVAAIGSYRTMKGRFTEFPSKPKKEKEELFNDLISAYYQIKKLEKIKKQGIERKKKIYENKRQRILEQSKEDIQLTTKKIEVALKDNDVVKAIREYDSLKDIFESFPSEYVNERKAVYKHILNIYRTIKDEAENLKRKEPKSKEVRLQKTVETKTDTEQGARNETDKFMVELKKDFKEAIKLMKEKQLHDTELKMLEIKRKMHKFPEGNEAKEEKFMHLIDEIEQRILFLKNSKVENV